MSVKVISFVGFRRLPSVFHENGGRGRGVNEDELALRSILSGNAQSGDGPLIDIIPTPATEDDACRRAARACHVERLRPHPGVTIRRCNASRNGMEGRPSSIEETGKGIFEPYLPSARPALLGIGAKEQEVYGDGSKKNLKPKRQDRKYVPLVKVAREGSDKRERSVSPRRATYSTRLSRRSRNEKDRSSRRDDDRDRDRRYREDADSGRRSSHRDRERDRDGRRERSRERESNRKSRNY